MEAVARVDKLHSTDLLGTKHSRKRPIRERGRRKTRRGGGGVSQCSWSGDRRPGRFSKVQTEQGQQRSEGKRGGDSLAWCGERSGGEGVSAVG